MARSDGRAAREGSAAERRADAHPALIALARLLARQAARETFTASHIEQETQNDDEEA